MNAMGKSAVVGTPRRWGQRHLGIAQCCAALLSGFLFIADAAIASEFSSRVEHALRAQDMHTLRSLVPHQAAVDFRFALGKTPLMLAGKYANHSAVEYLIESGADVNARTQNGGTPLMFASIGGEPRIIEALLVAGATPNAAGSFRWTALIVAASKGHADAVNILLAYGANVNAADVYGWTPLMRAAGGGKANVVAILLNQSDIDVRAREERGASALHIASEEGHRALVETLVNAGAPLGLRDRKGLTAEDYARGNKHASIANWLGSRK